MELRLQLSHFGSSKSDLNRCVMGIGVRIGILLSILTTALFISRAHAHTIHDIRNPLSSALSRPLLWQKRSCALRFFSSPEAQRSTWRQSRTRSKRYKDGEPKTGRTTKKKKLSSPFLLRFVKWWTMAADAELTFSSTLAAWTKQ